MPIKNTDHIREVISEEIELVRAGKSNPQRANAISNLVKQLISSVRLDIEYYKYFKRKNELNTPLSLTEEKEPKKLEEKKGMRWGKCSKCKRKFLLEEWQNSALCWCPECRKSPEYKNYKEPNKIHAKKY